MKIDGGDDRIRRTRSTDPTRALHRVEPDNSLADASSGIVPGEAPLVDAARAELEGILEQSPGRLSDGKRHRCSDAELAGAIAQRLLEDWREAEDEF